MNANVTIFVMQMLKDTEERDVDFLIGQMANCARDSDRRDVIKSFRHQMIVVAAETAQESNAPAQRALDGGWLPPFEVMKLQARKVGGDFWTDIYPAQLEQMVRNGCDIRAIEPPPISAVTSTEREIPYD